MMKQTLYAEILEGLKTDEGMRTASDINDARLKELEVQAKL